MRALLWLPCVVVGFSCSRTGLELDDGGTREPQRAPVPVVVFDLKVGTTGTSFNFPQQSFTMPAGEPVTHLRFNWYDAAQAPVAFGTLYLLQGEYFGRPDALATNAGVIARSTGVVDGAYVFDDAVTLYPGVQYAMACDTKGSYFTSFAVDVFDGGQYLHTGMPDLPFSDVSGEDANFRLSGQE